MSDASGRSCGESWASISDSGASARPSAIPDGRSPRRWKSTSAATPSQDARHYRKLVEEHEIDRIVIGLPVHTSGREGELAAQAREWGGWLATVTGLPVFYFDERYTSVEADEILMRLGLQAAEAQGTARHAGGPDPACRTTSTPAAPRPNRRSSRSLDSEDEATPP